MIRAAESVFSGEKHAMTSAANGFDRAMLRLAERLLRNNIRFRGFVYTRVREFAPTRSRKCDKYATLGQNPGQYTATMRRKLCAVVDQMLTLTVTRPASQRVGLSEVPGNQGWAGLRARGTQMSRIRSSLTLLAGCAVALGFGGTAALAADMGLPTKAAPMVAAAPPPLDIHGFVEFDWESTLINPNGQVLGTHGAELMVAGLNWTLYHGGGWINSITVGGLVAADWINGFQGAWALTMPRTSTATSSTWSVRSPRQSRSGISGR